MRVFVVTVVGALGLVGCGGDAGTARSSAPEVSVAAYAQSLDQYCTGTQAARMETAQAFARANQLADTDTDAAFTAVRRAQLRFVDATVTESVKLARADAPKRYAAFASEIETLAAVLERRRSSVKRKLRSARTPQELEAVSLTPKGAEGGAFPPGLVRRAPACRKLIGNGNPRVQDAQAKSKVRNVVSAVESCFASASTYSDCRTTEALGGTTVATGKPQPGEVAVVQASRSTYRVLAPSASGNRFAITRTRASMLRSCSTSEPAGGCTNGRW